MSGMGPRRAVLVVNNFPPVRGGSAVVYANLARYAEGRIIVVAPRRNYADGLPLIGWREHDRLRSYEVIRLDLVRNAMPAKPPRGARRLGFLFDDVAIRLRLFCVLVRLVLTRDVRTICIGELSAGGWLAHVFGALPGLRVITYVHGEEITTEDRYDPGHARARRALLASDRVIAVSRFTQRAVEQLLGDGAQSRVVLIENGVDGQRFTPKAKAADLLDFYGLRGHFVFVSVCRLLEKKGVDNAIRAFATLSPDMPDARFLVVGTGYFEGALRALAEALGLAGRVIFAGEVGDEELVDHYRLGDVFVMPNRELPNGDTEGFGLVFLEANACGLPVIAGRDGGSTDAVTHGTNGLVVNGASVEEIAAAMRLLYEDEELRDRLRQQALAVAARAGWLARTKTFLSLCGNL